jgi:hypothetical protein
MGIRGNRRKTKKPLITINEIEIAVAKHYGTRQNIIVPNISWGFSWNDKWGWHSMHECDVFVIKKTGYAVEIEIKRSKSDLLNDFKKRHKHESTKIRELFYAIPEENLDEWSKLIPKHAGIITYEKYEEEIWDKKKKQWSGKTKWVTLARRKRNATPNKDAIKLTIEEQLKIAKLGTMRIWNLKEKMVKNEQNKK